MGPDEKIELISELSRITRRLDQRDSPEDVIAAAISALAETARALGVPVDTRRDDAPVFLEGTEKVETATWTQCGGLLFALAHDTVFDRRGIATRIARRLFELAPTHR